MRWLLGLLMGFLALAASTAHAGDMTICNRTDQRMEYAMIWDEGIPVFADIWKAAGWRRLDPGSCVTELRSEARQELYLSVRHLMPDGSRQLLDYGFDRINPCPLCDTALLGIEDFYCVMDADFQRTEDELSDMATCPPGYYHQLFNILGFSTAHAHLTINLK